MVMGQWKCCSLDGNLNVTTINGHASMHATMLYGYVYVDTLIDWLCTYVAWPTPIDESANKPACTSAPPHPKVSYC